MISLDELYERSIKMSKKYNCSIYHVLGLFDLFAETNLNSNDLMIKVETHIRDAEILKGNNRFI